MISLDNLTVSYGGWTLFDNISFLINPKDRIGLVGRNGAGKTTLLRIITGEQQPTSGSVTLNGDCTIGYLPQTMRVADTTTLAEETAKAFEEVLRNLKEAHPNSAELELEGISGRSLTVVGESLGGSRINIAKVDGIDANFSGSYPTLVVHNDDQPGHVADVTAMLAHKSINIATMQLYRAARGGMAVMVIECDQEIPEEGLVWLRRQEGIRKVTYLSLR